MRTSFRWLVPAALLSSAALSLLMSSAPAAGQAEQPTNNRQVLEHWKRDPDRYQRLLDDWQAFKAMPPEKQARIRKLESDLRRLPPSESQELRAVLERYVQWLQALPAVKRRQIETAGSEQAKLELIRKFRDEQWYNSLPRKSREELDAIKDESLKAERKLQLRALEQQRRREWVYDPVVRPKAQLKEKPTKLSEFSAEVQYFYDRCLDPMLTPEERLEVQQANDKPWPALARQLLEKSEKHPMTLPGPVGPVRTADLKVPQGDALLKPMAIKRLKGVEGKWPEFGQELQLLGARARMGLLPADTTPSSPEMLHVSVRDFVLDDLGQVLTPAERDELKKASGKWPDYPRTIVQLAEKHKKTVPLMKLPGPTEFWEKARTGN